MHTPNLASASLTAPFAAAAYRHLALQQGTQANFTLPVVGALHALAFAREAVAGESRCAIDRVMNPARAWTNEDQQALAGYVKGVRDGGLAGVNLRFVSGLWVDSKTPVDRVFVKRIREVLGIQTREVEFKNHPAAAARSINDWLAAETKRPSFKLPQSNPDVLVFLISAMVLSGAWQIPFPPERTQLGHFTGADGIKKLITMMCLPAAKFPFYHDKEMGVDVVELDYAGAEASLVVLLPVVSKTLAEVEEKAVADSLGRVLRGLDTSRESGKRFFDAVALPRYQGTTSLDLLPTLLAMGAEAAFSKGADMSGLAAAAQHFNTMPVAVDFGWDEQRLVRLANNGVKHQSILDTRAANQFYVNKSFLYIVRDRCHGEVLAIGRVAQSTQKG